MGKSERDELSASVFDALIAALGPGSIPKQRRAVMTLFRRFVARELGRRLLAEWGLGPPAGAGLFRLDPLELRLDEWREQNQELGAAFERWWSLDAPPAPRPPELLGMRFEALLGYELVRTGGTLALLPARNRKRTGSFYTPSALSRAVVSEALDRVLALGRLDAQDLSVCDPACGAGAFLVEVAQQLLQRRLEQARLSGVPLDESAERRRIFGTAVCGVDVDPVALDVARIVLYAAAREPSFDAITRPRLYLGDALGGRGFFDERGEQGAAWAPGAASRPDPARC